MKNFGTNLRAYRKMRDLTLCELGAITESSSSHLCEIENGKRSVSLDKALVIANALGCEIGDLVGEAVKLTIKQRSKSKQQ
jgi:transcriptional regulator with XRE-family HTH domain